MPNFVKIGQLVAKILRFFNFSRWRPPPSWIFENVNFYLLTVSGGPRRITVPNFVKIGRSVTDILRFFEFSRWPPLQSWIFENVKFFSLLGSRVARRISMPNFVKIGQSVAKILRFFKMAAAAILYFRNSQFFICCRNLRVSDASVYQISSKSLVSLRRYCIFSNFQDGRRRHLGFLKSRNFIGFWGPEGGDASTCQILPKSVNQLRRYQDFSIFQDGHRPLSWICLGHIWTTHSEYLGVSITLQSLVMIEALVFII